MAAGDPGQPRRTAAPQILVRTATASGQDSMSRRTTLLLLLALSAGHAQAANLVASVDRSRLNSGETVELTVESSDVTQFGKPDLSPLDAQFEVSGTRQINQLTTLGGDNHATTRWIITLLPKENGTVVIPPLQVGEYTTQPISLQVLETTSQDTNAELAPVFVESNLDQNSVYVQAQTLLTVRVYHSVSLYDDSSLTPLQIPDARIEHLREGHQQHSPRRDRNPLRDLPAAQRQPDDCGANLQRNLGGIAPAAGEHAARHQAGQADSRQLRAHRVDGQTQARVVSRRGAVATGTQPDPERKLEPRAGPRADRRFPDPQLDGQGRGSVQRTTAGAAEH